MLTEKQMEQIEAKKQAIMLRINEEARTDISPQAHAACGIGDGRFVTVYAFPFQSGTPKAEFAWDTAERILAKGGLFRLS